VLQIPDLKAIARRLYERRNDGVMIPFRADPEGRFSPNRNECYENCARWTDLYPADDIVRGWLVLDYREVNEAYRFFPHPIIQDAAGQRFDITISMPIYPFLEIETTEQEFVDLVAGHQIMLLDHKL
jgi:hypothetical protein